MHDSFHVTVGAGATCAVGRRVELDNVRALRDFLDEKSSEDEAWWSPHVWTGNHRLKKKWETAQAVAVDVDFYDARGEHVSLPPTLARTLDGLAKLETLPGNIYHRTPRGLRLVFVLDEPLHDSRAAIRTALGVGVIVGRALAEFEGLRVDEGVLKDVARLFFAPRAVVDGVQREAEVYVLRDQPFRARDLADAAPESGTPNTASAAATSTPVPLPEHIDTLLSYIPARKYQTWIEVGAALKHEFGDAAFKHWDRWSQTCPEKYPGAIRGPDDAFNIEATTTEKWESFQRARDGSDGEVVTFGTVVRLARSHGWDPGAGAAAAEEAFSAHKPATIQLHAGALGPITDQAEDALLEAQAAGVVDPIYQRDRELVRVARLEAAERDRGAIYAAGTPVILQLDATGLAARLERAARFEKFDKRSKGWHRTDCPARIATHFLNRAGDWRVPVLRGIARAPVIRADGAIVQGEGYDAASGLWLDFGDAIFPQVPDRPGLDQARAAVGTLMGPASLFPWCADTDKATWLAAVLTAVCRHMLPTAPMFLFDSPVRGSGKTMLASLVGIVGTGALPVTMPPAPDDDEQRKRLFAVLRRGGGCVLIDNVEQPLEGASLCAALTQEVIEDRVLGESRVVAVPTAATMMASGNNVWTKGDLVRRVIRCRIDPQVEEPELREFAFDPLDRARRDRPALVAAALTLLRAHAVADRPQAGVGPFGSFETWSRTVRSALVWAGEADPCAGRHAILEADSDVVALQELAEAWHERHGDRVLTIGQALADADDRLRAAVDGLVGGTPSAARALGQRLVREKGRVLAGRRFVEVRRRRTQILWRVERVEK